MSDEFAYDFSIVPGPDPSVLVRVGAKGMLGYSFNSRQSDAYLTEIRSAGMRVVWVWERNTDSIFYADGAAECRAHEASAKPGELSYVACDTNDGGVAGRDLTPFLRDWAATTREEEFGLYGSSGAIRQGQTFGGKLTKFWGVVNWINGGGPDNAPENIQYWRDHGAHLVQLIGSDIPSTDQNLILRNDWWSIGTTPTAPPKKKEDDDMIYVMPTPFGANIAWFCIGGKKMKEFRAKDATDQVYGIPTDVSAWNNRPGFNYDVKFLDAEAALNLIAAQTGATTVPTAPPPASVAVNLTQKQIEKALAKVLKSVKV